MSFCLASFAASNFVYGSGAISSLSPVKISPEDGQGARNVKSYLKKTFNMLCYFLIKSFSIKICLGISNKYLSSANFLAKYVSNSTHLRATLGLVS
jgi:hypothetical protein